MSSESETPTATTRPENGVLARESLQRRVNGRREPPATGHAAAQLRARVTELEVQLGEVARCLEDAENRAAEVLALRERVGSLEARLVPAVAAERTLATVQRTRTWRFTAPVRTAGKHVRRLLGH